jgi:hypothetical protein
MIVSTVHMIVFRYRYTVHLFLYSEKKGIILTRVYGNHARYDRMISSKGSRRFFQEYEDIPACSGGSARMAVFFPARPPSSEVTSVL